MADLLPDPFKNYTPKPAKAKPPELPVQQQSDVDLAQMPRGELEALARRLLCQCGLAAVMTKEETAQAMLDMLAETALKPVGGMTLKADIQSRLAAIDKWLDRVQGKPGQSVQIDQNLNVVTVNASINFVQPVRDSLISHPVGKSQVIEQ